MKVYHVKTQADYDALMIELEKDGCYWGSSKRPPTEINTWIVNNESTVIFLKNNLKLTYGNISYSKERYPNTTLTIYKAKGEKMTQEKIKQELEEILHDVTVAVCWGLIDTSTVESDLLEAKSSAKKLIENIDEHLESLKPKFNVGDYVIEQNGNVISKIGEVLNGDFWGPYYKKIDNYFGNLGGNILYKDIERHATPEEIAEYESALSFHRHGRKPFELKRGDIVYLKGYDKNIFLDSGNIYKKHNFVDGDVILVKTVEEINEWLENK